MDGALRFEKKERFLVAHSFRNFSPWSYGPEVVIWAQYIMVGACGGRGVIAHAMKFKKRKGRGGRTRLSNNPSEVTPPMTNSLSLGHLLEFPAPPTGWGP